MTIQITDLAGLVEQFPASEVMYISTEKGKDIDKWDMSNVFVGFDMDDLRSRETYFVVALRNRSGEHHIYKNDCIAVVKGE